MRAWLAGMIVTACATAAMAIGCGSDDAASSPTDGGSDVTTAGDALSDAPVIVSFDAGTPACIADGGSLRASAVPAFGHFSGAVDIDICENGAFAYLEHTSGSSSTPSQYLFIVDSALSGNPATFFRFTNPADAASADFGVFSGVSAPAPGTYASAAGSCGDFAFCISFPIPPDVDCGDAGSPASCPPGCSLTGPVSGPACTPTTPENCYSAHGALDCVTTDPQASLGSWTLTLTSVTTFDGGAGTEDYVVHGGLSATMVGDDAGLGSVDLTIGF